MKLAVFLVGMLTMVGAQTPSPEAPPAQHKLVFRASADNLLDWLHQSPHMARTIVEVDPRILNPKGVLPRPDSPLHPADSLAGAAVAGKTILVSQARALECAGTAIRACRKDGVWARFVFNTPVVTGETGIVEAFVLISRQPTEEEKTQILARRTGAGASRLLEEVGVMTYFRLSLALKNGTWIVTERKIIGQS